MVSGPCAAHFTLVLPLLLKYSCCGFTRLSSIIHRESTSGKRVLAVVLLHVVSGSTEQLNIPSPPPPAEVPPPPSPNLPSRPLSSHGRGAGPGSAPPAGTRGAGRGGGAGGVRSGCGTARSGRRCGEWGCPRVGGSRRCARVRSVRAVPTVSAALRVRSASGVSDRAVLSLLCCRCALTARPAAWGRVGTAKQRGARGGGQQLLSERKGGEKRKNQVLAAITTCTYT